MNISCRAHSEIQSHMVDGTRQYLHFAVLFAYKFRQIIFLNRLKWLRYRSEMPDGVSLSSNGHHRQNEPKTNKQKRVG